MDYRLTEDDKERIKLLEEVSKKTGKKFESWAANKITRTTGKEGLQQWKKGKQIKEETTCPN